MWTNGVDRFFLYKSSSRFGATFEQLPHWPVAEETDAELSGARPSVGRFRLGEGGCAEDSVSSLPQLHPRQ
jgi:type I restriction enzyme M protein